MVTLIWKDPEMGIFTLDDNWTLLGFFEKFNPAILGHNKDSSMAELVSRSVVCSKGPRFENKCQDDFLKKEDVQKIVSSSFSILIS